MKIKSYLSVLISATFGDFEKKKYDPDWNPREELKNRKTPNYYFSGTCLAEDLPKAKSPEEMKQAAFDLLEEAAKNGVWSDQEAYLSLHFIKSICFFNGKKIEYRKPHHFSWTQTLPLQTTIEGAKFPLGFRDRFAATFSFEGKDLDFLNWNEECYLTDLVDENRAERERKEKEKKTFETLMAFTA